MEDLRLAFLVIGAIAIVGILVHGMWSVRKQSKENRQANLETAVWQEDLDDVENVEADDDEFIVDSQDNASKIEPSLTQSDSSFDDLGLSAVRVVSTETSDSVSQASTSHSGISTPAGSDNQENADSVTDLSEEAAELSEQKADAKPQESAKPKIYSSVVTQPKPEYAAQQVQAMRSKIITQADGEAHNIPEPPPFLLRTNELDEKQNNELSQVEKGQSPQEALSKDNQSLTPSTSSEQSKVADLVSDDEASQSSQPAKISLAEQARNFVKRTKSESASKPRKRREPKIGDDQMRIDFDLPMDSEQSPSNAEHSDAVTDDSVKDNQQTAPAQEVLILNVRANEDNPIQGSALLPMLLTLGFKFGDQDIFHRHVNSNGKGPVLFSLANMLKPGVFDIDNLENFSTLGVSLFMMLPIEGDPHQVFNMMHNAARKIADEFSAQVLDGRRSALTKQSLQQYVEKIREFERQRMIAK